MDLVDARKKARYTQQQVADYLGISRPTYRRMERNQGDITVEEAEKLANLFGVKVTEIFFSSNCN